MFPGKSARLKDAEKFMVLCLQRRAIDHGLKQPITTRLRCVLTFGFDRKAYFTKDGRESKRIADCTNLAELVQDSLEQAGIIENDRLLNPITIERVVAEKTQVSIELWAGHE